MTQKQRQELNLKVGDTAYFYISEWPDPDKVTIMGECEEGQGYEAHSPKWAAEHDGDGAIHTCNGYLVKTRQDARAVNLRYARQKREEYAKEVAQYTRCIQWLDYVIMNGGKL
jgi:hypothetical protein